MFETRPESVALREHPELIHAYNTVRAATTFFQNKFPMSRLDVDAGIRAVVEHVQTQLNAGNVTNFGRGRGSEVADLSLTPGGQTQVDRGPER
jgi:hypothetical protein